MVRIKHRYLLCHILYPTPPSPSPSDNPSPETQYLLSLHRPTPPTLTPSLLVRTLRASIGALFGDYGAGIAGGQLSLKYLSPATSTFILRAPRAHYRLVWAALTLMTALPLERGGEVQCVMRVVRVSGTIKKVEVEAVRRARDLCRRVQGMDREGEGSEVEDSEVEGKWESDGSDGEEEDEDIGVAISGEDDDDGSDDEEDRMVEDG